MELVKVTKPYLNICPSHWNTIRERIDHYGLAHLAVQSTNAVTTIIERALDGSYDSIDDFDPLVLANFHIWKGALQVYGAHHMVTPTDVGAKRCPLCEHALHDGNPDEWIENASAKALLEARRLGFVPSLQ